MPALEKFQAFFECGKIYENVRYDNHKEYLYRYCVRSIVDLREKIIPFFRKNKNKLYTAKHNDFELFADIVERLHRKEHLSESGLRVIARKIEQMNRKKKSAFLESPETTRRAPRKRVKI